jgi:hypothetical protein
MAKGRDPRPLRQDIRGKSAALVCRHSLRVRSEIASVRKWAAILAHLDCIECVLTPLPIPAYISGYRTVFDVRGNS